MRSTFLGPEGIGGAGACVPLEDGPTMLQVSGLRVLGDKDALTAMWGIKGSGGIAPCGIKCMAVQKVKGRRGLARGDKSIVDVSCSDRAKIVLRGDENAWGNVDALGRAHGNVGVGYFKNMERAFGANHLLDGLLQDLPLRQWISPTKSNRYDPMRIWFSNGVARWR